VYSQVDMAMHSCLQRQNDGSLYGNRCPSEFLIFGPYTYVSTNSDVRLTFDVEALSDLAVASDIVSGSAREFHGAMDPIALAQNEARSISLQLRMLVPARGFEARIGISAHGPATFWIRNLQLTID
jgi:hypothetical protein